MKSRFSFFSICIVYMIILNGCVSQKNLTYLQYSDLPDDSGLPLRDMSISITPAAYKIMPYDILSIRVITPDPQWSEIFNISASGAGGAVTTESAALLGYSVDEEGFIEVPFVGQVEVAGKNLSEVKEQLDSIFKNYLNDAAITVKMVNNFVSIIGEVQSPGRYPITKDRINVFEAISMAADMSVFSDRQKVQVIRQTKYGPAVREFSLKDRSILTSEYYYIMPNDVIYAPPLKAKSFGTNSAVWSLALSSIATILTSITTLFVIFDYSR